MRQVLGGMYDTYETFNVYLYQINQSSLILTAVSLQFSMVDVRISGLQFLNHTYNTVSRNNTNSAYLTSYLLVGATGTSGATTPMYNPVTLTFSKSTECVDLTIDMKCTKDQQYPSIAFVNACLGHFTFMFKIYGIQTRPHNLITNGSRM